MCPFPRRVADSVVRCSGAMTHGAKRGVPRPRPGRWSRHPEHRASRDRSRRRGGHPLPRTCPPGARRGLLRRPSRPKVLQSIVTNSSLNGRGSSSWINRATTSLPVPLSPIRRTEASLKRATSTISRRREVHASVRPASASCTSVEWTSPSTSAQRLRRAETSSARLASSVRTTTSEAPASRSGQGPMSSTASGDVPTARMRTPPRLDPRTRSRTSSETRSNTINPMSDPSGAGGGGAHTTSASAERTLDAAAEAPLVTKRIQLVIGREARPLRVGSGCSRQGSRSDRRRTSRRTCLGG